MPLTPTTRVTLAFERLSPLQLCARFSRGVGRPVRYIHGPIEIAVSIPSGYREHLEILQETLGTKRAPYFGPDLEYPQEARGIWEGHRGIEEYAREVFPLEEAANGMQWMEESVDVPDQMMADIEDDDAEDDDDDENVPGGRAYRSFTKPGNASAASSIPMHISGAYTPRSHPEGLDHDFFVGSC